MHRAARDRDETDAAKRRKARRQGDRRPSSISTPPITPRAMHRASGRSRRLPTSAVTSRQRLRWWPKRTRGSLGSAPPSTAHTAAPASCTAATRSGREGYDTSAWSSPRDAQFSKPVGPSSESAPKLTAGLVVHHPPESFFTHGAFVATSSRREAARCGRRRQRRWCQMHRFPRHAISGAVLKDRSPARHHLPASQNRCQPGWMQTTSRQAQTSFIAARSRLAKAA
jgi:hypothetical protein